MAATHNTSAVDGYSVRTGMGSEHFAGVINSLRTGGVLCDVILKGQEESSAAIPCHRFILSAHSTFFRTMFTIGLRECHEEVVPLPEVSAPILQSIIDYIYATDISIDEDNALSLLAAAHFLDIAPLVSTCWDFLERTLDDKNCLERYCFPLCEIYKPDLMKQAKAMVLRHFMEASSNPDFLELSTDKLVELISADDLCVEHEEDVLSIVVRWFNHDLEERRPQMYAILQCIRQPFLNRAFQQNYFLPLLETVKNRPAGEGAGSSTSQLNPGTERTEEVAACLNHPRKLFGTTTVICLIGGKGDNLNDTNCVEYFDPLKKSWNSWKSAVFVNVADNGVVNVDDKYVFLSGGYMNNEFWLHANVRYDPYADQFEPMGRMQTPRACHGAAYLNGYIYAIGGYVDTHGYQASMERYDYRLHYPPFHSEWQFVASLPTALANFATVVSNGRIYVFGGRTFSDTATDTALSYDPKNDAWRELGKMPTARYSCSACVGPSGLIYVIGGFFCGGPNQGQSLSCVEAYDTKTDQWLTKSGMIKKRQSTGAACVGNKIYVLGGYDKGDLNSVEYYDEASDTWTVSDTQLPTARSGFACVTFRMKNLNSLEAGKKPNGTA
ncbi:actin-binding protein IPP-like [Paramacrobiotus metropolitanus]|uniref:actin-binding protein IPP-like n=1 Tax=Paramacrobiotus metropolitanus TaxID=2943436 RepID=UPI00244635E7|nr:actin-binding protein IPP-like [Paramacrobiotus metropolitanus]